MSFLQIGIALAEQVDTTICDGGQLKNADLKPLVPDTKSVDVPEQNLDPITLTIKEQEQVARQRVLVKRLLGHAHQAIEAEIHPDRRRTDEDS